MQDFYLWFLHDATVRLWGLLPMEAPENLLYKSETLQIFFCPMIKTVKTCKTNLIYDDDIITYNIYI